jgi:hypothetical protein
MKARQNKLDNATFQEFDVPKVDVQSMDIKDQIIVSLSVDLPNIRYSLIRCKLTCVVKDQETLIGRTEVLRYGVQPTFSKNFGLLYEFSQPQTLRVDIYDLDLSYSGMITIKLFRG